MANLVRVSSPQPWRLLAAFDGTPSTTASNYTVARVDGLSSTIVVTFAWRESGNAVVLALSGPLLDGVAYTLAASGSSTTLQVGARGAAKPADSPTVSDLAERRWGLDLAWCSGGGLDSRGQVARRAGVECVRHDLAALCLLAPGELFHRPRAGANLRRFVNGPSTLASAVEGAIRSAWTRDPRVRSGTVALETRMDLPTGELEVTGQVTLDASGEVLAIDSSTVER